MVTIQMHVGPSYAYWFDIAIDENRIQGIGGKDYPSLNVPVQLRVRQSPPNANLLVLGGTLYLQRNPDHKIAEVRSSILAKEIQDTNFELQVPLFHHQVEAIEEFRKGSDADFHIDLEALISHQPPNNPTRIEKVEGKGTLQIPQSLWAEKILPRLGYEAIKVIEIPVPEKPTQEPLLEAWQELEKAKQSYYRDYEDTVSDCRKALQPLADQFPLEQTPETDGARARLKAFCNQYLKPTTGESNAERLGIILQQMWDIFSKPHHVSPPYHRYDAQLALQLTSAILAYIGQVLKHTEKSK